MTRARRNRQLAMDVGSWRCIGPNRKPNRKPGTDHGFQSYGQFWCLVYAEIGCGKGDGCAKGDRSILGSQGPQITLLGEQRECPGACPVAAETVTARKRCPIYFPQPLFSDVELENSSSTPNGYALQGPFSMGFFGFLRGLGYVSAGAGSGTFTGGGFAFGGYTLTGWSELLFRPREADGECE